MAEKFLEIAPEGAMARVDTTFHEKENILAYFPNVQHATRMKLGSFLEGSSKIFGGICAIIARCHVSFFRFFWHVKSTLLVPFFCQIESSCSKLFLVCGAVGGNLANVVTGRTLL